MSREKTCPFPGDGRAPSRAASACAAALLLGIAAAASSCATGAAAASASGVGEDPVVALTLVGTNDLHGWLEAAERPGGAEPVIGGIDMLGGYLEILRRQRPGSVVLVDAGDMFQGTLVANLTEGAAIIKAYNLLGYDAATVGNHEFDYGPAGESTVALGPGDDPLGALKERMKQAKFPFLTGNIFEKATGRPVEWPNGARTTMVQVRGVRVGIIGVTTPTTPSVTLAKNVETLRFADMAPVTVELAADLRRRGADIVVLSMHAGAGCSCLTKRGEKCEPDDLSTCTTRSETFETLQQLPQGTVDVALAAHTHEYLAHMVNGVATIQSGSFGQAFGVVELAWDRRARRLLRERTKIWKPVRVCRKVFASTGDCAKDGTGELQPARFLGETVKPLQSVAEAIRPELERVRERRNEALGPVLARPFGRDRTRESELGDFVADIMRGAVEADFAITNSGGLRADLLPGPLTYGHVFNALPFENRLALLRLTGDELVRLLDVGVDGKHGIMQVSGLRLEVTESPCAGRGRLVAATQSDGKPLDPAKTYVVVTNDFLAGGGDGFQKVLAQVPAERIAVRYDLPTLRDVVVAWLTAHKDLDGPPPAGPARIVFVKPACGAPTVARP